MDDLRRLELDAGFAAVLRRLEAYGPSPQQREAADQRWRKERTRAVPSPSALFRYLEACDDPEQEPAQQGRATIPAPTAAVLGLLQVNRDLLAFVQSPEATAEGHPGYGCHPH